VDDLLSTKELAWILGVIANNEQRE